GNPRIYRRTEVESHPGRVRGAKLGGVRSTVLLNEQTPRGGMKCDRGAEKGREQSCECIDGHQAAVILQEEGCGQIKIAATDPSFIVVICELCVDVFEAELPALAFGLGRDAAERFEHFEEADVVVAGMFDEV